MFGYFVLYGWFLFVFIFVRVYRPAVALILAIVGGYLFLPTQLSFDLPALPSLNKDTIPSIAFVLALVLLSTQSYREELRGWFPANVFARLFFLILVCGAFATVWSNGEPLSYGNVEFPAMRTWDALAIVLSAFVMLVPLILGRKYLSSPKNQRLLLRSLVWCGFIYSFLALYEIRMSPQLNNMVYGFFPHLFEQHIRWDGFRPIVFLNHGLWLSIFFAICFISSAGLVFLCSEKEAKLYMILSFWIFLVLVLSKSMGAILIASMIFLMIVFMGKRQQLWLSAFICIAVVVYPFLRSADLVPVNEVLDWATSISVERGESFAYRIENENLLLAKALERPYFGWGGWGRNFVYSDTGEGLSLVADGYWVLSIGLGGWFRYVPEFGLLCFPIILIAINAKRMNVGSETSILSLVLVANVVDLLPNATLTPVTWLIAGALWGRLEAAEFSCVSDKAEAKQARANPVVYSRVVGSRPEIPKLPYSRVFEASGEREQSISKKRRVEPDRYQTKDSDARTQEHDSFHGPKLTRFDRSLHSAQIDDSEPKV